MPEYDRVAKLIERRKKQEKQNDRIRVHKNQLEKMRLEKVYKYYDRSKSITKREFLTSEAKCVHNLEKIYERQCRIEDGRKIDTYKKKKAEKEKREREKAYDSDNNDEEIQTERDRIRDRVMSADKQEQAKSFLTKVKTLSSGYRDNDPPLSYYRRSGIVPPDRAVTPQLSSTAQAQHGGGFLIPASAIHIGRLKMWHGPPKETEFNVPFEDNAVNKAPLFPGDHDVIEHISKANRNDNEGFLQSLVEEDENVDEEMSTKSSVSSEEDTVTDVIKVRVVKIRPSTAPGLRGKPNSDEEDKTGSKLQALPDTGILTDIDPEKQTEGHAPTSILHRKLTQRPSTAVGVSFSEGNDNTAELPPGDKRLTLRRQSSAISFSDLPPDPRRRSSVRAPPLALLHRRQSNVAQIQKNILQRSKLLKPKKNKMKKSSGRRMGLMQSVMTNAEQEILKKKVQLKSKCLEEERERRWHRAKSAPSGRCHGDEDDEDYSNYTSVRLLGAQLLNEGLNYKKKNQGQKSLLEANENYSEKLQERVKRFARPQTRG